MVTTSTGRKSIPVPYRQLCVVHDTKIIHYILEALSKMNTKKKDKRMPSIFKDESTGSCICLWKLAVAVATYVSICIV
jgi:hypothetical protein